MVEVSNDRVIPSKRKRAINLKWDYMYCRNSIRIIQSCALAFATLKSLVDTQNMANNGWSLCTHRNQEKIMSKKSQFLILALAVTLTACASTKIANNDAMTQQAVKEAAKSDISPDEATLAAAKRISDANDAGLRFFAPLHMAQAKDKLKLAQKLKKKMQNVQKKFKECKQILTHTDKVL